LIAGRNKKFFSFPNHHTGSGALPTLSPTGTGKQISLSVAKWPESEADHSPPSSAKV